jgi:hypothetical protein
MAFRKTPPAPIIRRTYAPDVERQLAALALVLGITPRPLPPRPPTRRPRPAPPDREAA